MGTHSGILYSYIHHITFNCSMRLAEVEQGGAGAELGLDSEEFCDGTHTNMVLAGLDVLCR